MLLLTELPTSLFVGTVCATNLANFRRFYIPQYFHLTLNCILQYRSIFSLSLLQIKLSFLPTYKQCWPTLCAFPKDANNLKAFQSPKLSKMFIYYRYWVRLITIQVITIFQQFFFLIIYPRTLAKNGKRSCVLLEASLHN